MYSFLNTQTDINAALRPILGFATVLKGKKSPRCYHKIVINRRTV